MTSKSFIEAIKGLADKAQHCKTSNTITLFFGEYAVLKLQDLSSLGDQEVLILLIEVADKFSKLGIGSSIMWLLTSNADLYKVNLSLHPLPMRLEHSKVKLVRWYKSFSFVWDRNNLGDMIRRYNGAVNV